MRIIGQINLGGRARDFHGPNYFDAFEQLGHEVTIVDHEAPLPDGEYSFFFHFYHSIGMDKIDTLKSRGITTVLLVGDEPCEFFRTKDFTNKYNIVFNQTGGPDNIESHRALGANMYPLPHCTNPSTYHPVELSDDDRRKYGADISFIGSLRTPGIRNDRLWIRKDLFPGLNFRMWGPGTENDRWIYPEECNKIYAASKVIWNPSAVADQPDWDLRFPTLLGGPACRIFNTAAAGAFQLAPSREDWYFQPFTNAEIVYYNHSDTGDLINLVNKYVNDDDGRRLIANAGRDRVLADHTYVNRAKVVIDKVLEYRGM